LLNEVKCILTRVTYKEPKQRAAVMDSGCSGAVRHMFCLGILQRSACFFYDIRGGVFSPLSSVLLILPLRDVSRSSLRLVLA